MAILKKHKENNNNFFSGWKAVGIGFISLLILGTITLSYIFLSPESEESKFYYVKLEQFSKNENESLKLYDYLDTKSNPELVTELNKSVIPV